MSFLTGVLGMLGKTTVPRRQMLLLCRVIALLLPAAANCKPRVDIFTTTPNTSLEVIGVPWTGPYIEMGMEYVREKYGNVLHFTHKLICDDEHRAGIDILEDSIENFIARHYYRETSGVDAVAFLAPCKIN